jgi:hypothetical protein
LCIPDTWRVEINPKAVREHGDVVIQSPKGNRYFVTWGALPEARRRYSSLQKQLDEAVQKVKKRPDVKSIKILDNQMLMVYGHEALVTHLSTLVKPFRAPASADREVWFAFFYCEQTARYYVFSGLLRDPKEFNNFKEIFFELSGTFKCH